MPDCWPLFDFLFVVFSRLREEVTNECPLQNVKGANRPGAGGESSRIQTHLGVGESTIGRIVIGAIRPWGERYSGRNVLLPKRTDGVSGTLMLKNAAGSIQPISNQCGPISVLRIRAIRRAKPQVHNTISRPLIFGDFAHKYPTIIIPHNNNTP